MEIEKYAISIVLIVQMKNVSSDEESAQIPLDNKKFKIVLR